jgi:Sec-independent protein secretion pathway component TatC
MSTPQQFDRQYPAILLPPRFYLGFVGILLGFRSSLPLIYQKLLKITYGLAVPTLLTISSLKGRSKTIRE